LANLEVRRGWIVTKLASSMTVTTFDSAVSELSQELYYVDAAIASMRTDAQQA